jgi:hypothetical protein
MGTREELGLQPEGPAPRNVKEVLARREVCIIGNRDSHRRMLQSGCSYHSDRNVCFLRLKPASTIHGTQPGRTQPCLTADALRAG